MRIIAGEARRRSIMAPKGNDTRPTQDYVRESLFNILMHDVPDAVVLDLFAGSGALALESISRGAQEATLVDMAAEAIRCIQQNVESLHFSERATVLHCDWQAAIPRLARSGKRFSLVFLDPPYRMENVGEVCTALADADVLAPDALMVVEHRKHHAPTLDMRFLKQDARLYGDTQIQFYRYQGGAANHA